jgi:transposase
MVACRAVLAGWGRLDWVVGFNFVNSDLDQGFLLPPDMREWLDPDDLVYFVLDAVAQFDLSRFEAAYRCDGRGGAAYQPQVMVGLLLFAYCEGVKSSRQIERRCVRDVAYRVLAGNRQPDHATIARFRDRHQTALAEVFVQVLRLCAQAGLVRLGLVALDGSKLRGDATSLKNYDAARADKAMARVEEQIAELLVESVAVDAAEDAAEDAEGPDAPVDAEVAKRLRNRQGRLAVLKAAKQRLDEQAAQAQRVQDQRRVEWERRRVGSPPAEAPPKLALTRLRTNLTDPESRILKVAGGYVQGFNAQAVVTEEQVVVAAEVVGEATDFDAFHPMLDAAREMLDQAGVSDRIGAVVADAGYASQANRAKVRQPGDDPVSYVAVPPIGGKKLPDGGDPPDRREAKDPTLKPMKERLASAEGRRLYARRKVMVEPVFGQMKGRSGPRLQHRGKAKVTVEWKMMASAHNLLKLWRFQAIQVA